METQQLWYYPDIAKYINKSIDATRKLAVRGQLPEPSGKVGRSPYWEASRVINFFTKQGGKKHKGGRPRNPHKV